MLLNIKASLSCPLSFIVNIVASNHNIIINIIANIIKTVLIGSIICIVLLLFLYDFMLKYKLLFKIKSIYYVIQKVVWVGSGRGILCGIGDYQPLTTFYTPRLV